MLTFAEAGRIVPSARWKDAPVALLLIAWAFALYARTLSVPFLLDDLVAIPLLHPEGPLAFERIPKVLWPNDSATGYHGHFRPVGWASLVLDDLLFGFHAEAFRATAITLHALVGFLIYLLAKRLRDSEDMLVPLLGAGLFVSFGGGSESVVWICHRFTLLAALFFLLTLLLAIRFISAPSRFQGILLFLCASFALLSKDSILTELASVPLVGLVFSKPSRAFRPAALALLVIAGAYLLHLMLRYACVGTLFPSFSDAGNVAATFDPVLILEGLPNALRDLVAPVIGDGFLTSLLRLLLLIFSGVALVLILSHSKRRQMLPAGALLSALLLAGFPVLMIHQDLDGARRLYLPFAAWSLFLSIGIQGRAPKLLLGALIIAQALALTFNQRSYLESGQIVKSVIQDISAKQEWTRHVVIATKDQPGSLPSLPITHRGAPTFGEGATHLPLYFVPPLHEPSMKVEVLRGEALSARVSKVESPFQLVGYARTDAPSEVHPRPALDVRILPSWPTQRISIIRPNSTDAWPAADVSEGDHLVFDVQGDTALEKLPHLLLISAKDVAAAYFFVPTVQPGFHSAKRDGGVRYSFSVRALQPIFPVPEQQRLLELAALPATPGTVQVIVPSSSDPSFAASSRQDFLLGRAIR